MLIILFSYVTLFSKGDWQFSRVPTDRRVCGNRSPSESAKEHDVLYSVFLSHGSHVLYPLHVYGEHTNSYTVNNKLQYERVGFVSKPGISSCPCKKILLPLLN